MSRATSIAGVRPLGWPARVRAHSAVSWRAQRSCLADGAGAARLGPITALGNGARDGHARQRSGGQAKDMQTDTFARARCWRQQRAARVRRGSTLLLGRIETRSGMTLLLEVVSAESAFMQAGTVFLQAMD
jgi:hypothetical protein